jgi:hypothetical protein
MNIQSIQERLGELNYLGECVLREVRLLYYQTTLELVFNNIWTPERTVRSNLEEEERVTLRFHLVQEVRVRNELNASQLSDPELMNWGLNEISQVQIQDDPRFLAHYSGLPIGFHHAAVLWEGSRKESTRRIDIVFSQVEIVPG